MAAKKVIHDQHEKKCKRCGKSFIAAPEHIYRQGSKFYCSWTCYLHRSDPITDTTNNEKGN
ncbi:MAG: hypothetical protein IKY62_01425 [Clostridia bacterium]|nr:hypothetical protein [Clostridia bacterium]